jgi:hypothetical protein
LAAVLLVFRLLVSELKNSPMVCPQGFFSFTFCFSGGH